MSKPMPLSRTKITGWPSTVICPTSMTARSRGRVNLRAFESKLAKTCLIKPGSHSANGRGPTCQSICRSCASVRRSAIASSTSAANPGQMQEVVHQASHVLRGLMYALQVFLRRRVHLRSEVLQKDFGKAVDMSQGGTQVV